MQDDKIYANEITVTGDKGITCKNLSGGVSSTAQALATSGTITAHGVRIARIAPTAAVTAIVIQQGDFDGQELTIINETTTGTFTATAAASGTSNVADGTSFVLSGLRSAKLNWDASTSLWYHV